MKKTSSLVRSLVALVAGALLLTGCGGGGGGGGDGGGVGNNFSDPPPSQRFGASSQYAGTCDLETQKKFVRSYMDEVYLWYNEIPEVDPAAFSTIPEYFNALVVRTPDANGLPRDRFSTVVPASQARGNMGLLQDGSRLLANHTSFVGAPTTFSTSNGRLVGYLEFNDHDIGAQDDLIAAFRQLQSQGVQDLVLDLRRNTGGYLYIALTAASMITGPASEGQIFERLRFNDKRTERSERSTLLFSSKVQFPEAQNPAGSPLPQLGLPRVFILTSGNTCSASESIINSLRGIDVQVIRIGETTCGKPYGFERKENCGWAFFPLEFQGTNAKGFGDYTAGFTPTCRVQDDVTQPRGSTTDPVFNAAKFYIENNACPPNTATGVQSAGTPRTGSNSPVWGRRLLLPQQR